MVIVAGDSASGLVGGRDIGRMFRTQENKLREFTVYDVSPTPVPSTGPSSVRAEDRAEESVNSDAATELLNVDSREHEEVTTSSSPLADEGDDIWEQEVSDSQRCEICGHAIPGFAMAAHERFHAMAD
jgi:DNA polymerase iota